MNITAEFQKKMTGAEKMARGILAHFEDGGPIDQARKNIIEATRAVLAVVERAQALNFLNGPREFQRIMQEFPAAFEAFGKAMQAFSETWRKTEKIKEAFPSSRN